MTRAENEIKSLFEGNKGFSSGLTKKEKEVCFKRFKIIIKP